MDTSKTVLSFLDLAAAAGLMIGIWIIANHNALIADDPLPNCNKQYPNDPVYCQTPYSPCSSIPDYGLCANYATCAGGGRRHPVMMVKSCFTPGIPNAKDHCYQSSTLALCYTDRKCIWDSMPEPPRCVSAGACSMGEDYPMVYNDGDPEDICIETGSAFKRNEHPGVSR